MVASYTGSFFCTNCDWDGNFSIEKGITLDEAADGTECPNCGCKTVHAHH